MPISTPGKLASRRKNNFPSWPVRANGLTLIELLVAMTIVGLIFAVAATSLRSVFNVNLKSGAAHLASTLRYLSNKAVTDHLYLRMVYDLEEQSYHVEESADPFVVSAEEEQKSDSFTPSESTLLKPTKFPDGVFFKDVSVSYLPQKREHGQAVTYFFPDGFATATLINLKNEEDEDHYSVELLPLSGKVKVEGQYKEAFSEEPKK